MVIISSWLGLIIIAVWAYFDSDVPNWLPIVFWLIRVLVRGHEKIYNYKDWLYLNMRDEKNDIESCDLKLADKGLLQSGNRLKRHKVIHEDFTHERNKKRRALYTDLIDCLFLK